MMRGLNGDDIGMLKALRGDFRLASTIIFCLAASAVVLPFAVFRGMRGDVAIAIFDVVVVVSLCGAAYHAWRTRRYQSAMLVILLVSALGSVTITYLLGRAGLLWTYPVLMASFFIAPKHIALAVNIAAVIGVVLVGKGFVGDFERFTYLATSGLVALLAFLFAYRSAKLHDKLQALASYDALTSAGNRRLMEQDLAYAASVKGRRRGVSGLAILDLDHFKRVNDQHGHDAGDRVLMAFADIVRDTVRKPDRLYRLGGEEFVLLLPATTEEGLESVLDKVNRQVAATLTSPGGPVTVSIGGALLGEDEDWSSWLARADAALYQAKKDGRNRVVIAQEGPLIAGEFDDRRRSALH